MRITNKKMAMAIKACYPNAIIEKFCAGKYKWRGKAMHYENTEVINIDGVLAVYVERRNDKDGHYAQMLSVYDKETDLLAKNEKYQGLITEIKGNISSLKQLQMPTKIRQGPVVSFNKGLEKGIKKLTLRLKMWEDKLKDVKKSLNKEFHVVIEH